MDENIYFITWIILTTIIIILSIVNLYMTITNKNQINDLEKQIKK
jgi:hypothetical protein